MLKAARIAAWLLSATIVVASLVPPELRPTTDAPHDLEHFAIYAATGLAFGLGYGPRYPVTIAMVIFAGAIEVAQLFVPGRHARLSDFIVDALAACIGLAASHVLMRKLGATFDTSFPRQHGTTDTDSG
jgi:VanZ family protein